MQVNNGYSLLFISRRLRSFFRPKRIGYKFPSTTTGFVPRRYTLRFRSRKPLWRFFRPRHVLGYTPPFFTRYSPGEAYSLLFISRRLRSFFRPKRLAYKPSLPVSFLPRRYILRRRQRKPLWRFFRPRHLLGYMPAFGTVVPPSYTLGRWAKKRWRRSSWIVNVSRYVVTIPGPVLPPPPPPPIRQSRAIKLRQKRPLWRFYRPRHLLVNQQPPLSGAVGNLYALPYTSRRLRIYGRPTTRRLPLPLGKFFPQKRSLTLRYRQRKPLWRFFRPKHIFGAKAPAKASFLPRRYVLRLRPQRRPLWRFFRPKHIFGASAPQPIKFLPRRYTLRLRPQRRPLWRFFRPKHLFGTKPSQPMSFVPRRYVLPRPRQRKPLWRFYRPRHVLGYVPLRPASFLPRRYRLAPNRPRRLWYRTFKIRHGLGFVPLLPPIPPIPPIIPPTPPPSPPGFEPRVPIYDDYWNMDRHLVPGKDFWSH